MSDHDSPLRRRARALAEDARVLAEDVGGAARAGVDAAADYVEDGLDQTHRFLKRQWRERPVATAAAAVGVGMLIGLLISGRRR